MILCIRLLQHIGMSNYKKKKKEIECSTYNRPACTKKSSQRVGFKRNTCIVNFQTLYMHE